MLRFRPEVLPFLLASLVAAGVLLGVLRACGLSWAGAGGWGTGAAIVLCLYFLYFFRDPERTPPGDPQVIVSAGEGHIASIVPLSADAFRELCRRSGLKPDSLGEFVQHDVMRISVFLSPLNVHVNRAPIGGQSRFLGYFPGKHFFTFDEKSSDENQHNAILIENAQTRCLLFQIVGPVCRRVIYWLDHDRPVTVTQGDRIGMMKFGSRLDLYFPAADIAVVVKPGDFVRAGETVIARLRAPGGGMSGRYSKPIFINWRQALPSLFTLGAMLSGFLSILMAIQGIAGSTDILPGQPVTLYAWSALLIMLAMILDGIDGNLARWLHGESDFGAELDTYVDLTAFGIAPAILIFAVTMQSKDPLVRVLLPSAVALSGVVRLARFKAKDPLRGQGGYAGLPITVNAGWVALMVFISQAPPQHTFSLNQGPVAALFLAGILTFIVLQVTNLRYPKPTKKASLFIPMVILMAVFITLGHLKPTLAVRLAVVMLALGLGYVIIGPLFVKGYAAHKARRVAREDRMRKG